MKLSEINKPKGYTAWVLSSADLTELHTRYEQKYRMMVGHHITQAFGVTADDLDRDPHRFVVVGEADSGDGLQALVVEVDGDSNRPDGSIYHVTWSLDPNNYKPKDSNELIKSKGFETKVAVPINPTARFIPF